MRRPLIPLCVIGVVLLTISIGMDAPNAQERGSGVSLPVSIRITSPLGRTGLPGTIRLVAQVSHSPSTAVGAVRFFVNHSLVGEVTDGPPYAVEWVDANPFEPTEIMAEVGDGLGNTVRDSIFLKPFEIAETTQVSSVLLEAAVVDKKGRNVSDLDGPGYFQLLENGLPQAIDFVRPETMPAIYTLLVDSSQSMYRRMDFVRDAAGRLASFLRHQDRLMVVPFTRTLGAVTGPTDDRRTVGEAITAIRSAGGTAILDSLAQSSRLIGGIEGRHVIVLVTDGYDEHSQTPFDEVARSLQSAQATVYVIGVGGVAGVSMRGERLLRRVAAETGGRAFFPSREEELPSVHELVAKDVQTRYLVTYTPSNQKPDGTWREISLTTVDPTLKVRTRAGYFAPTPPPVRPSLEFTVSDLNKQLLNVTRDNLLVTEDGVQQHVDTFQEAVDPVSIVLALDASGSMVKSTDQVRQAARAFIESLRPEDSLALILFADRSVFAHDLTTRRDHSLSVIDGYVAKGGTALYDALTDGMTRLKRVSGRKVVVAVTDGRDENNPGTGPGSVRHLDDVLSALRETDAAVFTVGLGPKVDRELLERLARESGGESYFPEDVASLDADYKRIVENLRKRYVISYTSTNSTRDGAWRKVDIRTVDAETVVKSRGGYFAPAK
jgi:Ca-activated chloride channel family protein